MHRCVLQQVHGEWVQQARPIVCLGTCNAAWVERADCGAGEERREDHVIALRDDLHIDTDAQTCFGAHWSSAHCPLVPACMPARTSLCRCAAGLSAVQGRAPHLARACPERAAY